MTADKLRKAEARCQRADAQREAARQARDDTIRAAIGDGWTHAQVADATGLTRGRIGQIATDGRTA